MRDVLVVGGLVLIGGLDAMFAGFRASCGRGGLIRRRRQDLVASGRGLALGALVMSPVVCLVVLDLLLGRGQWSEYTAAGRSMLTVYVPYAVLVIGGLVAYAVLDWRHKFIAGALILGPFTLARPLVAALGATLGAVSGRDLGVSLACAASVVAVLLVEPLSGRLWYTSVPAVEDSPSAPIRGMLGS